MSCHQPPGRRRIPKISRARTVLHDYKMYYNAVDIWRVRWCDTVHEYGARGEASMLVQCVNCCVHCWCVYGAYSACVLLHTWRMRWPLYCARGGRRPVARMAHEVVRVRRSSWCVNCTWFGARTVHDRMRVVWGLRSAVNSLSVQPGARKFAFKHGETKLC